VITYRYIYKKRNSFLSFKRKIQLGLVFIGKACVYSIPETNQEMINFLQWQGDGRVFLWLDTEYF